MDKGGDEAAKGAPFQFAKGGFDPMLLGSVGILLFALTFIIWRLLKLQWDEKAAKERLNLLLAMNDQGDDRREANVAGGMRRNVRRRVNRDGDEGNGFIDHLLAADAQDAEVPESFEQDDDPTGEKVGRRKAAKMAAKAEKKAQREYEMAEREERKKRDEEREKKRDEEREKERKAELEEEERKKKEKEEKERRELEEYMALKASFAVEGEGYDALEGEEAENLIRDFVEYVKTNKVVNIDELSAHFGLKSDEAVSRLKYFIDEGLLQGVTDDRGKFVYIDDDELAAVAKFINQRGRVSIGELAEYSNQLVRLEEAA